MRNEMQGSISSIQTLGTLDGPGVRFVAFLQGCPLRCGCCHNPETRPCQGGELYTAEELVNKALRYREYFGELGGITLSGGEPLLQPEFSTRVFELCHENGINTCLDTSGFALTDKIKALIAQTDRILLDVKYTDSDSYQRYVGCELSHVLDFLAYLNEKGVKTTIRQVIIPTLNDTKENITRLAKIIKDHPCIDKTELLPFKKICLSKYDNMGIAFPFADIPTPTREKMNELELLLKSSL